MGTSREYAVVLDLASPPYRLTPGQPNILVDNSGNARIADFGLATVTQNQDSVRNTSCQHTPRWTAPEVSRGGAYTKEADIFSFAMVMIEVRQG